MVRTKKMKSLGLALVLGATVIGCAKSAPDSPFRRQVTEPVQLLVDNNNFLDVTVYAVAGGASVRLGEVTGKSSGVFSLDPRRISLGSGLQVLVDPLGESRTYLSPTVFPQRGLSVVLNVASNLAQSFIILR